MQRIIIATLLLLTATSGAGAGMGFLTGNDTGGIIAWSPENQRYARSIAADHCARYRKLARITSVRRGYGYYIGFACQFPRSHFVLDRRGKHVVLRVRY